MYGVFLLAISKKEKKNNNNLLNNNVFFVVVVAIAAHCDIAVCSLNEDSNVVISY